MDIYKITGILILLTSICFLVVAVLTTSLVFRKKHLIRESVSFTMVASVIMPLFEFALFATGTYAFVMVFSSKWQIPVIAVIFLMIYCVISIINLLFLKNLFANIDRILEQNKKESAYHTIMIDNISHEIRNPMNTIVGMTEIIKKDPALSSSQSENIDNLSNATFALLGVVNNIMDYTKIQCNKLDIIPTEYAVGDMLNILIEKAEYSNKEANVDFVYEISPDIPRRLKGDDVRIIQVIYSLISNSFRFTHVGIVAMKVSSQLINNDTALLKVDIEDSGEGISPEDAKNAYELFDNSFQRGDNEKATRLSLYIIKTIVERMNGTISFRSAMGNGTVFTVAIPQNIEDPVPIGTFTPAKESSNFKFIAPMAKILVVDDSMVNLFVAKELLSNYNIEVTTATSGAESIKLVQENSFDMVFMDYLMPQMDGREAQIKIRNLGDEYYKGLPIIALTAKNSPGGERVYIDEGFDGYLAKPLDVHELERSLLKFLPAEYINKIEDDSSVCNANNVGEKPWYKRLCSVLTDFEVKKGLEYCEYDYTAYINLLRVISTESSNQGARIKSYAEAEDIENYRVAVHSLKNVASSAGDMKLSFICSEHENAAKNYDINYIKNHVNTLLSEYEVFRFKIDTALQRENEIMNKK
ncbi:MAG: response regulator [Lachnospiraceae bacterium]|nr:response regulator [Lachnospiraceae bacterium]